MTNEDFNYYQVLGVPEDASKEDINKAYRKLIPKYHPDIAGEAGKAYTKYLNQIQAVLTDDSKRADYDRSLHAHEDHPRPSESSDDENIDLDDIISERRTAPEPTVVKTPKTRTEDLPSPDHVRYPFSIKFVGMMLLACSLGPLSSLIIGTRFVGVIPTISFLPDHGIVRIIALFVYGLAVGYGLVQLVKSRFFQLVFVSLTALGTGFYGSLIPGYNAHNISVILVVWILLFAAVVVLELVRCYQVRKYERMRRQARIDGRHVYMVMSERLDEAGNIRALLSDERDAKIQKTIWGAAHVGDYLVLGDGDEIIARVPYDYAVAWIDIMQDNWRSNIFA